MKKTVVDIARALISLTVFLILLVPIIAYGNEPSPVDDSSAGLNSDITQGPEGEVSESPSSSDNLDIGLASDTPVGSGRDTGEPKLSGRITVTLHFEEEAADYYRANFDGLMQLGIDDLTSRISEETDDDKRVLLQQALESLSGLSVDTLFNSLPDGSIELVTPLPYLQVSTGGETVTTDENGEYAFEEVTAAGDHTLAVSMDTKAVLEYQVSADESLRSPDGFVESTRVVDSTQLAARAREMGESMAVAQAERTYSTLPTTTDLSTGNEGMTVVHANNIVGCNKAHTDYTPNNQYNTNFLYNSTDLGSFPLQDSDCAVSITFGFLTTTTPELYAMYPYTYNCYVESLNIDGANVYCNGANKSGHYNCSWFNPLNHTESLHTHYTTGWQYVNGSFYYYTTSTPAAVIHWQNINGYTYRFNAAGQLMLNWDTIDGYRYYFRPLDNLPSAGPRGTFVIHWQNIAGYTYRFNAAGHQMLGWDTIDGYRYYFRPATNSPSAGPQGTFVIHWQAIAGYTYRFNAAGHQMLGWDTIDGYRYYFRPATNSPSAGPQGTFVIHWQAIAGYTYRFNAAGHQMLGWDVIDGNHYYFRMAANNYGTGPIGSMLKSGTWTIGSRSYTFNSSGVCTNY